jgi:N-hydroxyarylamine O-acetyltransferase
MIPAMAADPFDRDAYLERIGIGRGGRPSLAEVHRAHVSSIPFENLDPHRGVPVVLTPDALQHKLVRGGRGGYCFEQNLLLAAALRSLGYEVEPMLGRVRLGRPAGVVSPRTHLVLRVRSEGRLWLADAGFGNATLHEPIPFAPGGVHEQSGWSFRLVRDGAAHLLQYRDEPGWTDLYSFVPEPVPAVDIETSNWFTSTHPRSPFVTGLIVSLQDGDGGRIALSDWTGLSLTEETSAGTTVTPVAREQVPELLSQRFRLPGFALAPGGRLTLAG